MAGPRREGAGPATTGTATTGKKTTGTATTVVVGRVARAHGVRGEVSVEVRTDDPASRFPAGAVLATSPASAGPLRVEEARPHGAGRLLVRFSGVADRTAAEALRGVRLLVDAAGDPLPGADDDEFYDHQLIGLAVRTVGGEQVGGEQVGGEQVGTVCDVLHLPAQDLLVVAAGSGELLVPFVQAIVVRVDLAAGEVLLDPPTGLLDPGPSDPH